MTDTIIDKQLGNEHFIVNSKGDVEFVVISAEDYARLLGIIEDNGLAKMMQIAENDKFFSRDEALSFLEND